MDRFLERAGLLIVIAMLASDAAYALPIPSPVVIDFETEDDFTTPLVNGQSIYSTARPNNVTPAIPFASDTVLEFGDTPGASRGAVLGADPLE